MHIKVEEGLVTAYDEDNNIVGKSLYAQSFESLDRLRWHSSYKKILAIHKTRREAIEWLHTLDKNPQLYQHLERLRTATIVDHDDKGFFAVLKTFAESLGYTVIYTPIGKSSKHSRRLYGRIWYASKTVYVNPRRTLREQAMTLAHELAHHYVHYTFALDTYPHSMRGSKQEQLVEALAAMILHDYGLEYTHPALIYIKSYENACADFSLGAIDKELAICYTDFSYDLQKFLEEM